MLAPEPELPFADAARAVCDRAPARVLAKYKTKLNPVAETANDFLHKKYGVFDCAFNFANPIAEAGALYFLTTAKGPVRCTFVVRVRVILDQCSRAWRAAGRDVHGDVRVASRVGPLPCDTATPR